MGSLFRIGNGDVASGLVDVDAVGLRGVDEACGQVVADLDELSLGAGLARPLGEGEVSADGDAGEDGNGDEKLDEGEALFEWFLILGCFLDWV